MRGTPLIPCRACCGGIPRVPPKTAGCPALRVLRLGGCRVDDRAVLALCDKHLLRELDLSQSLLTSTGLQRLAALTQLESLVLNHSSQLGGQLSPLQELLELKVLSLDNCRVKVRDRPVYLGRRVERARPPPCAPQDDSLGFLTLLHDLESLCLSDTSITDELMPMVGQLTHLRSLDVGQTEVTSAGVRHLKGLTGLTSLCLDCKGVDDSAMPYMRGE